MDNFGLIKQNTEHLEYDIPYPNTTLCSEYNIIKQIYQVNKEHNITASFMWVKGHQDLTKEANNLKIEAQLNIVADSYETQWKDSYDGDYFPIPLEYPSAQATLIIQNQAVTSNYCHHLIRAYTEPQYIDYLQGANGWSKHTVQSIAWKSLSLGITRINQPVIVTKICNQILPMAVNLKKWS